jgi:hypothetical protein
MHFAQGLSVNPIPYYKPTLNLLIEGRNNVGSLKQLIENHGNILLH